MLKADQHGVLNLVGVPRDPVGSVSLGEFLAQTGM